MATYVEHVHREEDGEKKLLFSTSLKGEYKDQIHELWFHDEEQEWLRSFGLATTEELEQIGLACLRVANFTKGWNDRHFDEHKIYR